ncbi:MAG: ComF family protein [Saprospirales bacterium]|nr:MAG: ComF family protein [Saprospirales bacterium]
MQKRIPIISNIVDLIFPNLCPACLSEQPLHNHFVCLNCLSDLPFTHHYQNTLENELAMAFWGRLPLSGAASILYFSKDGKAKQLLQRIKYEGRRDIGIETGKIMGHYLKQSSMIENIDLIIPVPLHPRKKAKRGFNQCDLLAQGLSETTGIPTDFNAIIRSRNNPSQTSLSRENRFHNSQSLFKVTNPEKVNGKSILLIDDVITTGATLESCGRELLEAGCANLYISTLACGELI